MSETWEYQVCRASADIDLRGPRPVYHSKYPADTGPYGDRLVPHDCPIRRGLLPPQIENSPNARRKS